MKRCWIKIILVLLVAGCAGFYLIPTSTCQGAGGSLKAGFIYVGVIRDYGSTHGHNQARLKCEETFPWLKTVYVESVPEKDVGTYIDRLIKKEKCDVVFTTAFGFMDGTLAAAKRYPDKIFAQCQGFRSKRVPNMATYEVALYQAHYLNGLMAGALTKTGKVGYVATYPFAEPKRNINAFTIGVREANPNATVHVRWIYEWYNPAAAKEAAHALIADGCDVFASAEESPTVVQVAAENGLPSFGYYSSMYDLAPDYVVSGQLVHWEMFYLDFLAKVYADMYTAAKKNIGNVVFRGLLREGAVEVGAKPGMLINPKFKPPLRAKVVAVPQLGKMSVYDLIMKRLEQMKDPQMVFDPFTGPIEDRKGNWQVAGGTRLAYDELITMEWAVEGIVGPWSGEPSQPSALAQFARAARDKFLYCDCCCKKKCPAAFSLLYGACYWGCIGGCLPGDCSDESIARSCR